MHQLRKVQQIRRKKKSHKYKVERKKPDREHTLFESIYIKFKIQPNYLLVMSQETFFFLPQNWQWECVSSGEDRGDPGMLLLLYPRELLTL